RRPAGLCAADDPAPAAPHPQPLGTGEPAVSQASHQEPSGLSPTLWARVDDACLRYEAAWQAGQPPEIEPYLGEAAEPGRSGLLRERRGVGRASRRCRGERPAPEE